MLECSTPSKWSVLGMVLVAKDNQGLQLLIKWKRVLTTTIYPPPHPPKVVTFPLSSKFFDDVDFLEVVGYPESLYFP